MFRLAFVFLVLSSPASAFPGLLELSGRVALGDIPVVDDAALVEPCAAARALDACPTCTCVLRTATSRVPGLDERTSDLVIGAVLELDGQRNGEAYTAAHIVLGTPTKLTHVGRIADAYAEGASYRQYEVEAHQAELQMCPGACDFDAAGVVHPFTVTITDTLEQMLEGSELQTTVSKETLLVVCNALITDGGAGPKLGCTALPIAGERRVIRPSMSPQMKTRVLKTESYKRSWKLGQAGDLILGKATGKLASTLKNRRAHKPKVSALASDPDARTIAR